MSTENTNEKAQSAEEIAHNEAHERASNLFDKINQGDSYHAYVSGYKVGKRSLQSRISQLESDLAKSQEKCKAYEGALSAVKDYLSTKTVEGFEAYTIVEQALKSRS